jgi:hypothetical protein
MLPGENGLEQRLRLETEGVAFRSGKVWMEKHQYSFEPAKRTRKKKLDSFNPAGVKQRDR